MASYHHNRTSEEKKKVSQLQTVSEKRAIASTEKKGGSQYERMAKIDAKCALRGGGASKTCVAPLKKKRRKKTNLHCKVGLSQRISSEDRP